MQASEILLKATERQKSLAVGRVCPAAYDVTTVDIKYCRAEGRGAKKVQRNIQRSGRAMQTYFAMLEVCWMM